MATAYGNFAATGLPNYNQPISFGSMLGMTEYPLGGVRRDEGGLWTNGTAVTPPIVVARITIDAVLVALEPMLRKPLPVMPMEGEVFAVVRTHIPKRIAEPHVYGAPASVGTALQLRSVVMAGEIATSIEYHREQYDNKDGRVFIMAMAASAVQAIAWAVALRIQSTILHIARLNHEAAKNMGLHAQHALPRLNFGQARFESTHAPHEYVEQMMIDTYAAMFAIDKWGQKGLQFVIQREIKAYDTVRGKGPKLDMLLCSSSDAEKVSVVAEERRLQFFGRTPEGEQVMKVLPGSATARVITGTDGIEALAAVEVPGEDILGQAAEGSTTTYFGYGEYYNTPRVKGRDPNAGSIYIIEEKTGNPFEITLDQCIRLSPIWDANGNLRQPRAAPPGRRRRAQRAALYGGDDDDDDHNDNGPRMQDMIVDTNPVFPQGASNLGEVDWIFNAFDTAQADEMMTNLLRSGGFSEERLSKVLSGLADLSKYLSDCASAEYTVETARIWARCVVPGQTADVESEFGRRVEQRMQAEITGAADITRVYPGFASYWGLRMLLSKATGDFRALLAGIKESLEEICRRLLAVMPYKPTEFPAGAPAPFGAAALGLAPNSVSALAEEICRAFGGGLPLWYNSGAGADVAEQAFIAATRNGGGGYNDVADYENAVGGRDAAKQLVARGGPGTVFNGNGVAALTANELDALRYYYSVLDGDNRRTQMARGVYAGGTGPDAQVTNQANIARNRLAGVVGGTDSAYLEAVDELLRGPNPEVLGDLFQLPSDELAQVLNRVEAIWLSSTSLSSDKERALDALQRALVPFIDAASARMPALEGVARLNPSLLFPLYNVAIGPAAAAPQFHFVGVNQILAKILVKHLDRSQNILVRPDADLSSQRSTGSNLIRKLIAVLSGDTRALLTVANGNELTAEQLKAVIEALNATRSETLPQIVGTTAEFMRAVRGAMDTEFGFAAANAAAFAGRALGTNAMPAAAAGAAAAPPMMPPVLGAATRWRRTALLLSAEQAQQLVNASVNAFGDWAPANSMASQVPRAVQPSALEARIQQEAFGARTFGASGRNKRTRYLDANAAMRPAYGAGADSDSDDDDITPGRRMDMRGATAASARVPARMTAARDALETEERAPQFPVGPIDPTYNYEADRAALPVELKLAELRARGVPFLPRLMYWWLSRQPITRDSFAAANSAFGPLCEHFVIRPEVLVHANSMVLFAGGAQTGITAVSRAYAKEQEDSEAKRTVRLSLRVATIVTRPEAFHLLPCTSRNYLIFGHGNSIFDLRKFLEQTPGANDVSCPLYDPESQQYKTDLVLHFVPPRTPSRYIRSIIDFSGTFVHEEFPKVDTRKIPSHYPGAAVISKFFELDAVHRIRREKQRQGMPLLANTILALGSVWRYTGAGFQQVTNSCSAGGHVPLFRDSKYFNKVGPDAVLPMIGLTVAGRA